MRLRRTALLLDVLLALTLTGLSILTISTQDQYDGGWPGVLLATLAVAPLALRQVAPVLAMAVIVTALGAYVLLGYGEPPSAAIGMVIAMFSVATLRPRWVAAAAYPATVMVVALTFTTVEGVTWPMVMQAALILLCAWALGEATRRWAQEVESAAAAYERALAQERARIARELHDVVAHHMAVVALQTGVAGYLLDTDPVTARTAVEHAATAGREALQDMGRMLGVLRTDDAPNERAYAPQPGLRDLDGLLDRVRSAGLDVRVTVAGPLEDLPAGTDLCAYRVVQESLTNVLRHAGAGATAQVSIALGDRVLQVDVINNEGRGQVKELVPGSGQGIRGMHERTELYGGMLATGPTSAGGFGVHLRLPVSMTDGHTPRASAGVVGGQR